MGPGAVNAADRDSTADLITSLTRQVADFPTAGIQFKDLTPLFADRRGLAAVTDALADVASGADLIAGIDARGFLIGGAVAARLGTGQFDDHRSDRHLRAGLLEQPVRTEHYQLEYGTASLEVPADGIELTGRRVVIVDDVLATGGTLAAAHRLLEQSGAQVTIAAVVIELAGLGGRELVAPLPVHSVVVL
jgi:adenine phosphoribosyltransferase